MCVCVFVCVSLRALSSEEVLFSFVLWGVLLVKSKISFLNKTKIVLLGVGLGEKWDLRPLGTWFGNQWSNLIFPYSIPIWERMA